MAAECELPMAAEEAAAAGRREQCERDAAALAAKFRAADIAWIEAFLADYLFYNEPLDQVLAKARELSGLPPRPKDAFTRDD